VINFLIQTKLKTKQSKRAMSVCFNYCGNNTGTVYQGPSFKFVPRTAPQSDYQNGQDEAFVITVEGKTEAREPPTELAKKLTVTIEQK
jgi:hypothetical protein